ncbi:MAG: TIGR01777 family protein [bacterium]|nr:TIGR01777 family protein [bacterium]
MIQRFQARSKLDVQADELARWHHEPAALERLSPPWGRPRVLERSRHAQRFTPVGEDASTLVDEIDYELPFGVVGRWLGGGSVRRVLERTFRYRHRLTAFDMQRLGSIGPGKRLHVAISGASGLVGSTLAAYLSAAGHRVSRLVRRPGLEPDSEIAWDLERGTIDSAKLSGVDAVVHLAGEGIAAKRWTAAHKRRVVRSRVLGTKLIADALAGLTDGPRTLISASAIGFYGDRGDETVDEASEPGDGFLADTTLAWEGAAASAANAGVRVALLRTGIVLAAAGGALGPMLPLFRAGLGGRLGDGRTFMSWIALNDLIGAVHHCICDETLRGPVNAVAPNALRNAEFIRVLARVLRRPAVLPAPRRVLEIVLGEMAKELLLSGAHVRPSRLEEAGFRFQLPELEPALRFELGLLDDAGGPEIGVGRAETV